MRRAAITTVSTVAGVILLLSLKPHDTGRPVLAVSGTGSTTQSSQAPAASSSASSSKASASASGGSSGSSTSGTNKSGSVSGTFVGSTVQTDYGPVQVEITVSNGKLTGVTALQTPSAEPRSQDISAYAVPRLTQEALGAQSAQIDAVSGASYTSAGYVQSLQSALDKSGV